MKRKAAIGLVVLALSAVISRAGAQVSTGPRQTDEEPRRLQALAPTRTCRRTLSFCSPTCGSARPR